jgi:hypothetical protein
MSRSRSAASVAAAARALHDRYDGGGYRGDHRWRRSRGLTLIFVGAAVTVAMWQSDGD